MSHILSRNATVSTTENVLKREVLARSPRKSIKRAAQKSPLNKKVLGKIITIELKVFPYKFQEHHPLKKGGNGTMTRVCNEVGRIDNNTFHVMKVWFNDEAHFTLDGYVHKQNWRI
ncbi:hypothetical protein NPIL_504081 [Nephila pilipes]|uniref:Uncharacterized protein n=1 Tax=Nephila pilipes TaxID=299642 RepID=A0A8X6Q960_NEPPI|nr:hypothetical protein NPIL_504081 [Nephila pilipes]